MGLTHSEELMACYHPLIRVEDRSKRIRAKDGHYYFKATVISADKFELERTEDTNYFKNRSYRAENV